MLLFFLLFITVNNNFVFITKTIRSKSYHWGDFGGQTEPESTFRLVLFFVFAFLHFGQRNQFQMDHLAQHGLQLIEVDCAFMTDDGLYFAALSFYGYRNFGSRAGYYLRWNGVKSATFRARWWVSERASECVLNGARTANNARPVTLSTKCLTFAVVVSTPSRYDRGYEALSYTFNIEMHGQWKWSIACIKLPCVTVNSFTFICLRTRYTPATMFTFKKVVTYSNPIRTSWMKKVCAHTNTPQTTDSTNYIINEIIELAWFGIALQLSLCSRFGRSNGIKSQCSLPLWNLFL